MPLAALLRSPALIIAATQLLFTSSDLLARYNMRSGGFRAANFLSAWFAVYFVIRQAAMFGQLYIFTRVELGKTMAMFGACSLILANLLGWLLLAEILTPAVYAAIALAVTAYVVLALN